jgi:hypothetical protein
MLERRRWPRWQVAWSARVLIADAAAISAQATDASLHGLRLAIEGRIPGVLIREGEKCRVEIVLADDQARFCREAEVRHVSENGIGLSVAEALPAALLPSLDKTGASVPRAESMRRLPLVLDRLRRLLPRRPEATTPTPSGAS